MNARPAVLIHSWAVGCRTCTLSVPRPRPGAAVAVCVEWEPYPPPHLSGTEWDQYRAGRNAALAALARILGGNVVVVEL